MVGGKKGKTNRAGVEAVAWGFRSFFWSLPGCNQIYRNHVKRYFFEKDFPRFVKEQGKLIPGDIDGLMEFATVKWRTYMCPAQVDWELRSLLSLLNRKKGKRFMEIGTSNGGTLFLFCKIFGKGSSGISVDLPGSSFGGGYPPYRVKIYQSFVSDAQELHLLREDSHAATTLEKVEKILGREKLDFLFIDGDHTYDGVKQDYEMYSHLVRNGGIIAFHDIADHPPGTGVDVARYWNELKRKCKHKEIIADRKQGWAGIGVIYK